MTSQEKLIRFMKGKASLLSEALGVPPELYFNEDDKGCLRQLDDQWASAVWRTLELAIHVEETYGLGISTCPFCIASRFSCSKCCYATHHGVCGRGGDDYTRIVSELPTNCDLARELLTNEFYASLLKTIEKEDTNAR